MSATKATWLTTVRATIAAPASKSVSHRALIAAALAGGTSTVRKSLVSDDLRATRACLSAAGATIEDGPQGALTISGTGNGLQGGTPSDGPALLDVNESGTTCRLITGVAGAGRGSFTVRGAGRMHQRPIGQLTEVLTRLGVTVDFLENDGYPPLTLHTEGFQPDNCNGEVAVSLAESSQYLSGLLLGAPLSHSPLTLTIGGHKAVSWPYVGLTLDVMHDFGIDFDVQTRDDEGSPWADADWRKLHEVTPGRVRFVVRPSAYTTRDYTVEGDWSNASYFLAAGALGVPLAVSGLRPDSLQGDRRIALILATMGACVDTIESGGGSLVTVQPRKLVGVEVDMGSCPDLVPTVAVAACFAHGPTTITNVAHLRIKESDRIEAVASQVRKVGCEVDELPDGLRVMPRPLPTGETITFDTFDDHRIAMSTQLFELAGITVRHDNPACVNKSFPDFFARWEQVRAAQTSRPKDAS